MGLNCGIVGLPNVGKSTLFKALTAVDATISNYPFCTIDPNVGIVNIPDSRVYDIGAIIQPLKITPATIEFVDIAGLVKGAHQGDGLGNQFLGHIRNVNAIIHVVRCFDDDNIIHVSNAVNPMDDIDIVHLELCLADLETVQKRQADLEKRLKSQDKAVVSRARAARPILSILEGELSRGIRAAHTGLDAEELEVLRDLHLLTLKPILYVCNVSEHDRDNAHVRAVAERASREGTSAITVCAQLEAEMASFDSNERRDILESLGLQESGLDRLIRHANTLLGLQTFFTTSEKEVRAWTFRQGMKTPEAAGLIHSDFERGFIKAEVYSSSDLLEYKSEAAIRENGLLSVQGKEYAVQDGDVIFFRFNV